MASIVGAVAGAVVFLIFGLMPAFRFGGFLTLFLLSKITGKPVESSAVFRILVAAGALLCIVAGTALSAIIGAAIGSLL